MAGRSTFGGDEGRYTPLLMNEPHLFDGASLTSF